MKTFTPCRIRLTIGDISETVLLVGTHFGRGLTTEIREAVRAGEDVTIERIWP